MKTMTITMSTMKITTIVTMTTMIIMTMITAVMTIITVMKAIIMPMKYLPAGVRRRRRSSQKNRCGESLRNWPMRTAESTVLF